MANLLHKFLFSRAIKFWILMFGFTALVVGCGDILNEVSIIIISPSSVTVGVNQTTAFSAIGKNSVGNIVSIIPTWGVTGNIGTISSTGLFKAGSVEADGKVFATASGQTGEATVTMTTKGWLTGNVKDTNGELIHGITVYLKESPSSYNGQTDESGNYLISGIPAGTYEADINASPPRSAGSEEVVIFKGQTTTQDFILFTPTTVTTTTTLPF